MSTNRKTVIGVSVLFSIGTVAAILSFFLTGPIRVSMDIIYGLSALLLNFLLYKSNLIPRWLSGWGFLAAILYLATDLANMYGPDLSILFLPLGLQEIVLAAWLIVKGLNPPATASGSA